MEIELRQLSASKGLAPSEYAARLLRRALRAGRPRPMWDAEKLKAYAAEYGEEELPLAESDPDHRTQLLRDEDNAE
jgi:hypothetical protein